MPLGGKHQGRSLHIIVADPDPAACQCYRQALTGFGHLTCVAQSGPQLVAQCRSARPDLVVAAAGLPDLDGVAAIEEIGRERPIPIVLVAGDHDAELLRRALDNAWVMVCLSKPVREGELGPAVAVAMARFEQFESLRREAADLRQALEDRKLIERAKGTVMKYAGFDEQEAHHRMQKLASVRNRKLVEIARDLVAAGEILHELDQVMSVPKSDDGRARNTRNTLGTSHNRTAPERVLVPRPT